MDTKEKRSPSPQRRKRPAGTKRRTAAGAAAGAQRRHRRAAAAPRSENQAKRVIRAPREDIPEAVYTMPKPFRKGKFLLRLVSVVAVVLALMGAVSIFFKVDTITVLGANKYTAYSVREASGIEIGEGLLTLSKARAAGKIRSALPYVDEVKITRQLPGTVNIEIVELDVTYAIGATDNTWWLITSQGRVVEQIDASAAAGYARIFGVQVDAPRAGQTVTAAPDPIASEATEDTASGDDGMVLPTVAVETNAQRLAAALTILQSLEANEVLGQVASVNVSSLTDIQLQYGQRFLVKLGTDQDLAYKIAYMVGTINDPRIEDYETGTLDVSFEYMQGALVTPES